MLEKLTFSIDKKHKKNIQRGLFLTLSLMYIMLHIFDINTPYYL